MKQIVVLLLLLLSESLCAQTEITTNYKGRLELFQQGVDLMTASNTKGAIACFKKMADTDNDTFLVAAKAYEYIARCMEDSIQQKLAGDYQSYYLSKSIQKYPDNKDGYIDRLRSYKFEENKSGEAELIQVMKTKFNNSWEVNFELGYHYVYSDFLWPDSELFDTTVQYFHKVLELNPAEFNTLLLMSVAYEKNKEKRYHYLLQMYKAVPSRFSKNTEQNKNKYPYKIESIRNNQLKNHVLTSLLTHEDCLMLKLPK